MAKGLAYRLLMHHQDVKDDMPDHWFGFTLRGARRRRDFLRANYPGWSVSICLVECWQDSYEHYHFGKVLDRNI